MATAHTSNEPGKGRRTAQPQRAARKKASSPAVAAKQPIPAVARSRFSDEEWYDMVATAAYYRAESRGFEEGSHELDWYAAEEELEERLAGA